MNLRIELLDAIPDGAVQKTVQDAYAAYCERWPDSNPYLPVQSNRIAIAWDEDRLVGFIVWMEWSGDACVGLCWTAWDYRRRGVYRTLLGHVEAEAIKLNLPAITAWVLPQNEESFEAHTKLMGAAKAAMFTRKLSTMQQVT